MESKKAALAEKRLSARNREHPHPACREIFFRFGSRRNNYAVTLAARVVALYKWANKHCRDGWLTIAEATEILGVGCQARTGRARLDDVLTLEAHFTTAPGDILLLKTQFLSREKREAAIASWDAKRDAEAVRKRRARGALNARAVSRRREYGPPDPSKRHFRKPGPMSRSDERAFKAIFSNTKPSNSDVERDPVAEIPPLKADATTAEKRAYLAALHDAEERCSAAREPSPKPKPKPIPRDQDGVPLCFLRLGFKNLGGVWKRYEERFWWMAYHRAKNSDRLGPDRGGAITHGAREFAAGRWKRAI